MCGVPYHHIQYMILSHRAERVNAHWALKTQKDFNSWRGVGKHFRLREEKNVDGSVHRGSKQSVSRNACLEFHGVHEE